MTDSPDGTISFIIETNVGGVPVTVCACGAMLLTGMVARHTDHCVVYQRERER